MTANKKPVSPVCPSCGRATKVRVDGTWSQHRVRQDPAAAWCEQSGRDALPVGVGR
jgi:hypothetical protein